MPPPRSFSSPGHSSLTIHNKSDNASPGIEALGRAGIQGPALPLKPGPLRRLSASLHRIFGIAQYLGGMRNFYASHWRRNGHFLPLFAACFCSGEKQPADYSLKRGRQNPPPATRWPQTSTNTLKKKGFSKSYGHHSPLGLLAGRGMAIPVGNWHKTCLTVNNHGNGRRQQPVSG